jgi:hypothetical protein
VRKSDGNKLAKEGEIEMQKKHRQIIACEKCKGKHFTLWKVKYGDEYKFLCDKCVAKYGQGAEEKERVGHKETVEYSLDVIYGTLMETLFLYEVGKKMLQETDNEVMRKSLIKNQEALEDELIYGTEIFNEIIEIVDDFGYQIPIKWQLPPEITLKTL